MRKTLIILPAITFILGLLTGAAVFSQPQSEAPPATPAAPPASEPPIAVAAVSVPEAPEPAASAPAAPPPDPRRIERLLAAETAPLRQRIDELADGWGRTQAELAVLRERLTTLERRPLPVADRADDDPGRPAPPQTAQQRRALLVQAGVAPERAEEIVWQEAETTLGRLELRDIAAREGWLGTERYRDELRQLRDGDVALREAIDARAYDRWLYLSGEDNRIGIDRVIPGSAGEEAGLQPGDLVETYDGEPVFDYQDLRSATSLGERDQLVPVQVRRGGELVEIWLPRGPIGIQLDATRAEPLP